MVRTVEINLFACFAEIYTVASTYIRTPYECCKTSFKMGLDYVLKGPSDYRQKVKRHCGVTQKQPFSRFEITGFVFGFFFRLSLISKQKHQVFYFNRKVACFQGFFSNIGKLAAGATFFSRIDLADCAGDQFYSYFEITAMNFKYDGLYIKQLGY